MIGVDEVGRGAWAGPLLVCAVEIDEDAVEGLNDSKKLTKKRRESLSEQILKKAQQVGYGWVEASEIDEIGLAKAMGEAVKRALKQIDCVGKEIIFDGNVNYWPENPKAKAVVRADGSIASVSAASIVAKVARDSKMANYDKEVKGYNFASHVGYGTAKHAQKLKEHGVSSLHRRSFKPIQQFLS